MTKILATIIAAIVFLPQHQLADARLRDGPIELTSSVLAMRTASRIETSSGKLGSEKGLRFVLPQAKDGSSEEIAALRGTTFRNGTIEIEVAGTPAPGSSEVARGFVGVAFRVSDDLAHYEAFYLRA